MEEKTLEKKKVTSHSEIKRKVIKRNRVVNHFKIEKEI